MRAIVVGLVLISATAARAGDCDLADVAGGSWSTLAATEFDRCAADPVACQAQVPPRATSGAFATGEANVATVAEARTGTDAVAGGELTASGRAGWHHAFEVCGHTDTVAARDGRGEWSLGLAWPHGFAPLEIAFDRQWELRPALDASRVWLRRTYTIDALDVDYAIAGWRDVDGTHRSALPFRFSVSGQEQDTTRARFETWWFALYESRRGDESLAVMPVSVELMYGNGVGPDAAPIPPTSWLAQVDALDLVHRFGAVMVDVAGGYVAASSPLPGAPVAARARATWGVWSVRAARSAQLAMDQVMVVEDRLSADLHDGRWRASAFVADTRTSATPDRALTGGGGAGVDLALPEKIQLALDVGMARSYYARLDGDVAPRPELAETGTVRLERHFNYVPR